MAIIEGKITCGRCREPQYLSAYPPSVVTKGCGECRSCARERGRAYARTPTGRAKQRVWRSQNRERVNARDLARYHRQKPSGRPENTRLKTRYGITLAEYEARLIAQGGRCACCGATSNPDGRKLFVDHDHATGVVRGLLCGGCNRGIGALGDTIEGVRRAVNYLERVQQPAMPAIPALRINLLQGAN